jgi:prepilin-type N-terminal cleavage/methylation domain-containing protein
MHTALKNHAGFSLIELMVSLAIFLVVCGAAMGAMVEAQRRFRSMEIRTAIQSKLRGAFELMAQEIGQAGLPGSGIDANGLAIPLTTTTAVVSSGSTITVAGTAAIIPGEIVTLDSPANQEAAPMQVKSVTSTTVTFYQTIALTHASGAPVYVSGVFPGGVLSTSTASKLEMFGDLKAMGSSLVLVEYLCPSTFPGLFTRSEYDAQSASLNNGPTTLVDNVTACSFTYPASFPSTGVLNISTAPTSFSMVTSVGVSLTVQSQTPDPITGQYFVYTKTFLNIQPRNILAANQEVIAGNAQELQPYDSTKGIFASLP